MTHPFHPLCGQQLELAMVRDSWGDALACYRDGMSVRWMPCRWTSLAAPDPFVLASAGRAWFRAEDLVRLSDLVDELQATALAGDVRVDGQPVAQAAQKAGLSRQTFYQTLAAYERAGLHGLLPGKPGPRSAHKLSPEVVEYVKTLLKEQADLTSSDLVEHILERFAVTVHPRSIERALARHQKKAS